jgi:hypothetical protein
MEEVFGQFAESLASATCGRYEIAKIAPPVMSALAIAKSFANLILHSTRRKYLR